MFLKKCQEIFISRVYFYFCIDFGMEMTDEPKKLLNNLEVRVKQLMFRCNTLEEQKKELLVKLGEKEDQLMKTIREKEELQNQYLNLKTAQSLACENSDTKETKARFTKLVREIDKCIALLNE